MSNEYPVSILTLGPDDVALFRLGVVPDDPKQAQKMLSDVTQSIQRLFRPDQMSRVMVIPHDMDVIKITAAKEPAPKEEAR